jgi:hypothetical protein
MDAFINFLQSDLFDAILVVLGIVFTRYLLPWAKAKMGEAKFNEIYNKVETAVTAAEKVYEASGMGPEKRKYVLEYLRKKGVDVTDADIDIMIEAACKALDIMSVDYKAYQEGKPAEAPKFLTESDEE